MFPGGPPWAFMAKKAGGGLTDGPLGWNVPSTLADFDTLLLTRPQHLYLMQDTDTTCVDAVGGVNLNQVSASASYQQTVSGWSRKWIGRRSLAEVVQFRNIGIMQMTNSWAVIGLWQFGPTLANAGFFTGNASGGDSVLMQVDADGNPGELFASVDGQSGYSNETGYTDGNAHWICLQYDITNGRSRMITEKEVLELPFSGMSVNANNALINLTGTVLEGVCGWMAVLEGADAEQNMAEYIYKLSNQAVPVDGPNDWARPTNPMHFYVRGLDPVDHLWLCQEASGDLNDEIGSVALPSFGADTHLYQQSVADWDADFVGNDLDGGDVGWLYDHSVSAAWDVGVESVAVIGLIAFPGTAGSVRNFLRASVEPRVAIRGGGSLQFTGDVNILGSFVFEDGLARYFAIRHDVTNEIQRLTAGVDEELEVAFTSTTQTDGVMPGDGTNAPPFRCGWMGLLKGSKAEQNMLAYIVRLQGDTPTDGPDLVFTPSAAVGGFTDISPDHLWDMDEASGSLIDKIGTLDLAAQNTPLYQQTVAGWARHFIGLTNVGSQGFFVGPGSGWDASAESVALFGLFTISTANGTRTVACIAGSNLRLQTNAAGTNLRIDTDVTFADGSVDYVADGEVHPFWLIYNRATKVIRLFTDLEVFDCDYSSVADGNKGFGVAGTSIDGEISHGMAWEGVKAEALNPADSLKRLGWNPSYIPKRDGLGAIRTPDTLQEWAAATSFPVPDHYWKMNETSGNLADTIGSMTLTAHGSPLYNQTVINWRRPFVGLTEAATQGFTSSWNIVTNSLALLVSVKLTADPVAIGRIITANRQLANDVFVSFNTDGTIQLSCLGSTASGSFDYVDGNVHPIFFLYDRANSVMQVWTDKETFTVTYSAASSSGSAGFGAETGSSFDGELSAGTAWVGSKIEGVDGAAVLRELGWELAY